MAKSGIYAYKYIDVATRKEQAASMGVDLKDIPTNQAVELTAKEVKETIMKVHGWTSAEYKKKYDIFKNKLRAYESYKTAQGTKAVTIQSPAQLLYKQAMAMKREGADYEPSIEMKRIQSFSAVSITKGWKYATNPEKHKKYNQRAGKIFYDSTTSAFEKLIEHDPKAQEIAEKIENPVKREEALADYAEKMHAVRDKQGKVTAAQAIPFGERVGSPDNIDFDYGEYLEE